MKGQLSAEMLIILVVVLGLAVVLASVMMDAAKKGGDEIDRQTNLTISAGKGATGTYCIDTVDCRSGLTCEGNPGEKICK